MNNDNVNDIENDYNYNWSSSNIVMSFINLINETDNEKLHNLIVDTLYKSIPVCESIIGEGHHGMVVKPNYGKIMSICINNNVDNSENCTINLKTVIKKYKTVQTTNTLTYKYVDYVSIIERYKKNTLNYNELKKIKFNTVTILYGS